MPKDYRDSLPLLEHKAGTVLHIVALAGGKGMSGRLRSMGIREGKDIEIVTKHPMKGPLVVRIEGRSVTIGRGIASKIIAEEKE